MYTTYLLLQSAMGNDAKKSARKLLCGMVLNERNGCAACDGYFIPKQFFVKFVDCLLDLWSLCTYIDALDAKKWYRVI